MSSAEEKPGFTVTDRRAFAGGEQPASAPSEPAPAPPAAEPPPRAEPPSQAEAGRAARALPPVDFTTFVLSLGSSALMHLGEVEHPQSGRAEKDLPMAKHTIDLLTL